MKDYLLEIANIEKKLSQIKSVQVVMETILTEARLLSNADAGSIYIRDKNSLQIVHSQNDTLQKRLNPGEKLPYTIFAFPINEKSIAGYVAYSKRSLVIDDAYSIPDSMPFKFNKTPDIDTGYKTKSLYNVPLLTADGILLGVLQIINAKNKRGKVKTFSKKIQNIIDILALKATTPLERANENKWHHQQLLMAAEFRDPKETYPHVERVSRFAVEVYDKWASEHNINSDERLSFRDNLIIAAKFHDIGKIGVSDEILKFPGRHSFEQRQIMKTHVLIGAKFFNRDEQTDFDYMCENIALRHHEYYDGSEKGYPGKINLADYNHNECKMIEGPLLKENEIPLEARIVSVCDVFDALCNKRCYKEAWTIDESFSELERCSGSQFDPELVRIFVQLKSRILAILNFYTD